VSEYRGEMMILTREWKMAVTSAGRPYMLFDVRNDPAEASNLAGRPDFAEVEGDLSLRLFEHLLSTQVQILNYYR
jgi:arylsulfatase A-like enzyme